MPPKKTDTVTDSILTSHTSEEVSEIKESLNAILLGTKSEETRKDECVRQQENPHHGFAPGNLERLLVGGPVLDEARYAVVERIRMGSSSVRHNESLALVS